ncbi:SDR family NAD(P)-dependent oxidoreductase [Nocardia carnea]|uniref:SDR family NAD(P)-dependent oxidoreductase n=1 Tax=Nocardia carnea TaxID=37328 RepID=UPI002455ABA2|nr:SDR family NAD(P)-dependent oxidoreductase [Nocardia carnea]
MTGVVIIGAGPGLGLAIARRFAREGMPIAAIARTDTTLQTLAAEPLEAPLATIAADCTDEITLRDALTRANEMFGLPDVVVYNAAVIRPDLPGELSVHAHQQAWAVNVVGAINTAAQLVPAMARRGSGSFIVTGGMPKPKPEYVSLSLGKAGVRALVDLLDKQYSASGVHIATVTIDGLVAPGTAFDPDDIAEHYWHLHTQAPHRWSREIIHTGDVFGRIADLGVHAQPNAVVAEVLDTWQTAFNERRIDDIAALFTIDALFQGIDPDLRVGPAEISAYYDKVADGTAVTAKVRQVIRLGEETLSAFAEAEFTSPTDEPRRLCLSLVIQYAEHNWRIRQYHAAPAPVQLSL